jgi:hypothetical protein
MHIKIKNDVAAGSSPERLVAPSSVGRHLTFS